MSNCIVRSLVCITLLLLCACAGDEDVSVVSQTDQGTNGGGEDMFMPKEDMSKGGERDMRLPDEDMAVVMMDMGMGQDMKMEQDMFMPPGDMGGQGGGDRVNDPQVISAGDADKVVLRGAVLGAGGKVFDPGEVLMVGGVIQCVQEDCSADPDYASATLVETKGVISPGLIDAHNHIAYNFFPEWKPEGGKLFENRYQWADDPSYEEWVRPLTANRSSNSHFCPGAKWGELRSLMHGTTTVQGQSFERSCLDGGVRNADHDNELQYDHMRTTIGSPRDITDNQAQNYVSSFMDAQEPIYRFAVHMAEGYSGNNVNLEFASFAGRDPRSNRHNGLSLLDGGYAVLIHSLGVTDEELVEVAMTKSYVVWSPSSNMVLYGRTANIARMLELGIVVGLGPDWTLSGEDDMLAEMRYAQAWAVENSVMALTPRKIWEMATVDGAKVVGLDSYIGELVPGAVADVLVVARDPEAKDLHEQVVTAKAKDVQLVMIGGKALYGVELLGEPLGAGGCEAFDTCGSSRFVCGSFGGGEGLESVVALEQKLVNILEGTGYPADEQYKRGGDLLPLVECN